MNDKVIMKLAEVIEALNEVMVVLANQEHIDNCLLTIPDEEILPEVLRTPEAEALHEKLLTAGILNANWQPIGLSNAEKGTLVEYIAEKLDLRNKWKLFGTLWKTDSETLRTAKARGLEQEKTWGFRNKLDNL